ncbi:MAG: hypothetical protein F6J93_09760 [Oscillatoria sp. SIO1A7]|nr:hypothetical protein [Oscillatoria sp. SIO1A7]
MIDSNIVADNREKILRYFHEHKRAFDVGDLYVINKFESFLRCQQGQYFLDCGVKIDRDIIHGGRFTINMQTKQSKQGQIARALSFFS